MYFSSNKGNELFDEFAMELKDMFANQDEESFDTYIRQK